MEKEHQMLEHEDEKKRSDPQCVRAHTHTDAERERKKIAPPYFRH